MIVDQLRNANLYSGMGEKLSAALHYLQTHKFDDMATGRHSLRGEEIYVIVARYKPGPMDGRKFEAHRKYYDVQFVANGRERMGYAPLETVTVTDAYNEKDDYLLGTGEVSFVDFPTGMFMILGPEDAHIPGVAVGEANNDEVLKVVVKVAVD